MSVATDSPRRLTVADIAKRYADGERLAMLTAYDYPTAADPRRGWDPDAPRRRLARTGAAGL
jgi:hypothetical protein